MIVAVYAVILKRVSARAESTWTQLIFNDKKER